MESKSILSNRRLIIQFASGQSIPLLELTHRRNELYSLKFDVDYQVTVGRGIYNAPPNWQKIPLIRQALEYGYGEVCWLDTDAVIVDTSVDIFPKLDKHIALADFYCYEVQPWDHFYNSGVMFIKNTEESRRLFDWVWHTREREQNHHVDGLYEENHINDYLHVHPELVQSLPHKLNCWQKYCKSDNNTIISGFHAMENKYELIKELVDA